jgi:hypothetical protein
MNEGEEVEIQAAGCAQVRPVKIRDYTKPSDFYKEYVADFDGDNWTATGSPAPAKKYNPPVILDSSMLQLHDFNQMITKSWPEFADEHPQPWEPVKVDTKTFRKYLKYDLRIDLRLENFYDKGDTISYLNKNPYDVCSFLLQQLQKNEHIEDKLLPYTDICIIDELSKNSLWALGETWGACERAWGPKSYNYWGSPSAYLEYNYYSIYARGERHIADNVRRIPNKKKMDNNMAYDNIKIKEKLINDQQWVYRAGIALLTQRADKLHIFHRNYLLAFYDVVKSHDNIGVKNNFVLACICDKHLSDLVEIANANK